MRTIKDPEERRNEILDTAQQLFYTKGYVKTTIIDILNEIGIAKGTFYYYYKSKEEVLDAIIMRISAVEHTQAQKIAEDPNLTAIEKLIHLLRGQKSESSKEKEQLIKQIEQVENIEMQHKSFVQTVKCLTPPLVAILSQGIKEKTMDTRFPKETAEFIIYLALNTFDRNIVDQDQFDKGKQMAAFIYLVERACGIEVGGINTISDQL